MCIIKCSTISKVVDEENRLYFAKCGGGWADELLSYCVLATISGNIFYDRSSKNTTIWKDMLNIFVYT